MNKLRATASEIMDIRAMHNCSMQCAKDIIESQKLHRAILDLEPSNTTFQKDLKDILFELAKRK